MFRYSNYRAKEWKELFEEYKQQYSLNDAINLIWSDWSDPENIHFKYLPTIELLLLSFEKNTNNINNVFINIQWDSVPVYGTWSNYWWNYEDIWRCEEWQRWWLALLGHYGKTEARQRWIYAYQRYWYEMFFDDVANKIPTGCSWSCDFINYFRTQGIDVAMVGAETNCSLINIINDTVNVVEDVTSGVQSSTSLVSSLLPIVTLVGGSLLIYNQLKKKK